ncbi:MAG TPA: hypothetical protein ENK06_08620 [Gammaproteobacteria bacterium]|nr:hypothetical protein [Gammaproteobacteria bacterium]
MCNLKSVLIAFIGFFSMAANSATGPVCTAPVFNEKQIAEIIARERSVRDDLPEPYQEYEVSMRRKGCHYVYIENLLPMRPGRNIIFTLNQYGVIVDVMRGR